MKKREFRFFFKAWKKSNKIYQKYCSGNHMPFPEALQKEIIMSLYDKTLKTENAGSYDFLGNIEMKSSTKKGGGCTPFSPNQTNCSRIIYLEITNHFDIYEISPLEVSKINSQIASGQCNLSLKNYLAGAVKRRLV